MKNITSLQNPLIKKIVALHDRAARRTEGLCIAEGLRTVTTFLQHAIKLEQLYVVEDMLKHAQELVDEDVITVVTPAVMKKISTVTTPSGMLGVFHIPDAQEPAQLSKSMVLAQLQDPGNMGTIIRTAAALGLPAIVVVEGVDPWSPKVIQASAGTIAGVTIFEWSWEKFKQKSSPQQRAALVVAGGRQPKELSPDSILMVGSEAHGLPAAWLAECGHQITLPMPGGTESLNAAVAASIALYAIYGNL